MIFNLFGRGKKELIDFAPGEEVELEIAGAETREIFITEIISASKKEIAAMIPVKGGERVQGFAAGTEVVVQVEKEGKLARFQTQVTQVNPKSNPPAMVLVSPKNITWKDKSLDETQRRTFVRLEEALPITYFPVTNAEREGTSMDISGSGLSMMTDLELAAGKVLPIAFVISGTKITCKGKVVRCKPHAKSTRPRFEIALAFVDIQAKDQDLIVRHIFERQRELRRRGLL